MKILKLFPYIGKEISTFSPYFDEVILVESYKSRAGSLKDCIKAKKITVVKSLDDAEAAGLHDKNCLLILNGTLNYEQDIQGVMIRCQKMLNRSSRLVVVGYNPYMRFYYQLSNFLGLRKERVPDAFVSQQDLKNISQITNFDCVKVRPVSFCPIFLFGLDRLINWVIPAIPFFRWFSMAAVITFRPIKALQTQPKLSIVIPARNEAGNIRNAVIGLESLLKQAPIEIIYVEGNSTDNTWEVVQEVQKEFSQYEINIYQQPGKGKNDAVKHGFAHAKGDLLTILDADLTVDPSFIVRFYQAYLEGKSDFINGSRLVLPMEKGAMRPLNRLGNIFFAKALKHLLSLGIGDSLCGTKLLSKQDYQRLIEWRRDFGDFDPFGDFDFLFSASTLCLGSVDIPIPYKARTYGETNISRFYHGAMLLKMTIVGFFRIKLGRV